MKNLRQKLAALGALLWLMAAVCPPSWAQGQQIIFSASGDYPYGSSEVSLFQQQMTNHNKYSPSKFFIHVGDILAGSESCDESRYSEVAEMMKTLAVPGYIVPGDNETKDCSNPAAGMALYMQYFQNFETNFCSAPYTEHQAIRPENWAFVMDGVLFVGLDLVYGNNVLANAADWATQQLQANGSQVRAAVFFAHYAPGTGSNFSTPFRAACATFNKPVLFLHGHGHSWSTSYPFPEPNIFRVQVNKGGSEDPVQVTVTMDMTSPATAFLFKRSPWSSKTIVNIPPCANAGPDQNLSGTLTTTLSGGAVDDGDPSNSLTTTWSKVSGPGNVTFDNAYALATAASFTAPGTYVLQLTANDTQLQGTDEVTITVESVTPMLTIDDVTLNEGHAGTTDAVFTVSLAASDGSTVTVDYEIVEGSATSGDDYVANPNSGTLTFPDGTNTQTITVTINGDQTDEYQDETFFVNLANASNADIGDAQGQGTILNDDAPVPPAAPNNLLAKTTGTSTVELSWNDQANDEEGFKVERQNGGGNFAEIAVLSANANSYNDTGLNPSTVYSYRVRAFKAAGHSDYSNTSATETGSGIVANPSTNLALSKVATASSFDSSHPPADAVDGDASDSYWRSGSVGSSPEWLQADLGLVQTVGRAVVRWRSDYFAKSYALQISNNAVDWTVVYSTTASVGGDHDFTFTPVLARYVRLYMTSNNASTYRIFEFEVYSGPNSSTLLAPDNLVANATGSSTIDLTWSDNSADEDGFKIERRISGGTFGEIATASANATSYHDTGLNSNTTYDYRVSAYNANGASGYSNEASATTASGTVSLNLALNKAVTAFSTDSSYPPQDAVDGDDSDSYWRSGSVSSNVPVWLRVDLGSAQTVGRAVVKWKSDYFAKSYELQVSNDDANWTTVYHTTLGAIGNEDFSFTAVSARYVRLYMTLNNKSTYRIFEFELYADPVGTAPAAPANLVANPIDGSVIALTWEEASSNEVGFKIERANDGGSFSEIFTTGPNVVSYYDIGLNSNTTYVYRVRAYNFLGDSDYSNEASATTPDGGGSDPSINLALGKMVTASSTSSGYPAANAADNNASTYWRSGSLSSSNKTAWLRVDLGAPQLVGRAVVSWNSSYYAKIYEIQVSNDASTWTTVYLNSSGSKGTQDFTFTPAVARYVQIYMTKYNKSTYRINELALYSGSSAAAKRSAEPAAAVAASVIPEELVLEQNYPNPFNPDTQIRFGLPQASYVSIKLYTITGAEVRTLVDGQHSAGMHAVILHAGNLPSGTYFYVLQAGAARQVRRLMLVK